MFLFFFNRNCNYYAEMFHKSFGPYETQANTADKQVTPYNNEKSNNNTKILW